MFKSGNKVPFTDGNTTAKVHVFIKKFSIESFLLSMYYILSVIKSTDSYCKAILCDANRVPFVFFYFTIQCIAWNTGTWTWNKNCVNFLRSLFWWIFRINFSSSYYRPILIIIFSPPAAKKRRRRSWNQWTVIIAIVELMTNIYNNYYYPLYVLKNYFCVAL